MTTRRPPDHARRLCSCLGRIRARAAPAAAAIRTRAWRGPISYVSRRQYKEAIIEYRRALQLAPRRADVHYKLANTYAKTGDLPTAYAAYSAAADLDPSLIDAQVQAGQLLLLAGDFERAKTRAEGAIAADARNVPARDPARQRARRIERHDPGDEADGGGGRARSLVGAGATRRSGRCSSRRATRRLARPSRRRSRCEPKSIDARLALANFDWAAGDRAAAETRPESGAGHRCAEHRGAPRAGAAVSHRQASPGSGVALQGAGLAVAEGGIALADYYNGSAGRTRRRRSSSR